MGLSLRSSLHLSHTAFWSVAGSSSFSMRPLKTPLLSVMRTSDFSFFESSSMVFHRPVGVIWAWAGPARDTARANTCIFMTVSLE